MPSEVLIMKRIAVCVAVLILALSFAGSALAADCATTLSSEEVAQIKAAWLEFEEEIRPLEEQLTRARDELAVLLDDPEADFDALQTAQAGIDRLQDERDQKWDRFEEELLKRFPAILEGNTCRLSAAARDSGQKGN